MKGGCESGTKGINDTQRWMDFVFLWGERVSTFSDEHEIAVLLGRSMILLLFFI